MKVDIDLQVVWNENKGEVQLFIGDFRIGLPPAACAQLEKDLAAARRVPEMSRELAQFKPSWNSDPNTLITDGGVITPNTDLDGSSHA
jgi:hypothetical protein